MRMSRKYAHTEGIGAAFAGGDIAVIKVVTVLFVFALMQNSYRGMRDVGDILFARFAVVGFDAHMFWIDRAEMDFRGNLERVTDQNVVPIFVADLHVVDLHLRPIF